MIYLTGATSQSVDVQIVDDTGLPVTGLAAATFPATSYSLAGPNAAVAIVLVDLALITSAWTSGGVKERSGGYYRLDVPDAALASAGQVRLFGETSGKHLLADPLLIGVQVTTTDISGSTTSTGTTSQAIEIVQFQAKTIKLTMSPQTAITGWTFQLNIRLNTAVVLQSTVYTVADAGVGVVLFPLTSVQTGAMELGEYDYDIWRTNAGSEEQLAKGPAIVTEQQWQTPP